jgi:bifunctional non-homologous end joining protein LigD
VRTGFASDRLCLFWEGRLRKGGRPRVPLEQRAAPFRSLPSAVRRGARFVRPELVIAVKFSEWTPDGVMRHPSYQGLREDKPAAEVVREKPKPQ